MKPPSGGPSIGPIRAGAVTSAMALTNLAFSTLRSRMRRPTGVIIAPPAPWTKRATTKWESDCEKAQAIDPIMNTAIAVRKMVRAPNRSAIHPLAGMKMASASR